MKQGTGNRRTAYNTGTIPGTRFLSCVYDRIGALYSAFFGHQFNYILKLSHMRHIINRDTIADKDDEQSVYGSLSVWE